MYMDQEDMSDASLALTLGYGGNRPSINKHPRQEPTSAFSNPTPLEPSLTLSLSDDADGSKNTKAETKSARVSSPHSTVSSFSAAYPLSVKTEKDLAAEDHEEHERVPSSRISDDEDEGNARKKLRLTKEQSALLEERFKEHSTLNPRQKQALARQLNLRPRQVEVWFQNRRARTKLKQTEVDCEFLKRCCQTLSDENRRLQKELQELRALKFAPATPLYMQIPAAALTMCPSCERIGGGGGDGPKGGASAFVAASKPHFFNPFAHPAAC